MSMSHVLQSRSKGADTPPRESQPQGQAQVPMTVAGASVLRGVALGGAARLLARRSGAADVASSAANPTLALSGTVAGMDAASTTHEGSPQAYERGFAAGREAGYAAAAEEGRALGAQQGYQEGLERGLQEGREQALAAAGREREASQHEAAQRLATLDRLLASLPGQIKARLQASEDDMVALCHAIVCRVLGETLAHGDGTARLVRAAVVAYTGEGVPAAGDVTLTAIHVHPRDLERLCADESLAAWLAPRLTGASNGRATAMPWVADESVGPGGCIVRSTEGSLDARLATQMAALTQWLMRAPRSPAPATGGQVER